MINNKLIQYKNEAKGFWNYLRNKKRIKDVKMKKEIDFEHLESVILEIEKNVVTNKEHKFAFAQPTNWDNFQTKMTLNLKKMKTTQEVKYHKGNI